MWKSQRVMVVAAILLISLLFGMRGIIRQRHARYVIRECMAATDALYKSPPGVARASEFIRRIRAVDTTGAPEDLVEALHGHLDALERSFAVTREGKDTKQLDEQAAAAKERFAIVVKKHW